MLLRGGATHEFDGLVDVERLWQVLESAALVGRHGAVEIGMRGHDDHGQLRPARADFVEQVESALARHADIGHEHVGFFASQRVQDGFRVFERCRLHAGLFQGAFEHPADGGIVVDEPDVKRLCWIHWYRRGAGS